MSNLATRISFAIPAAVLFVWMNWLGGWYFNVFVILIGLFIQHEIIQIMSRAAQPSDPLFPFSLGLWIMLFPALPFALEIGLGILILFIAIQTFNASDTDLKQLSSTFFVSVYAPIGLVSLMLIRSWGTSEQGFFLTMLVVLMVWGSDVFAYFGGKAFGKHPLAPSISPNKTVEGFVSGYVGCLMAILVMAYATPLTPPLSMIMMLPLAVLVGTFGPIGDLFESKLKRRAGVKDSSTLLPGHGGFFDRFDALILAAPAAFAYLQVMKGLGYVRF
ncbi:MAG: phosphatidate cytidylyltransferase [Bacteroidota bacterium]